MQYGHSKAHRPDLPQLKLMLAAADPGGYPIACDVHPGQSADDPLYQPLYARVREIVGQKGLLYIGDCKMASLSTRANIVAHGDYYLVPLPLTGETAEQIETWIAKLVDGSQPAELVFDSERLIGGGYEFQREISTRFEDEKICWTERVIVFRSLDLAKKQSLKLETRLTDATAAIEKLTPPPGRGRRQYHNEVELRTEVNHILEKYQVTDLLTVNWQRVEKKTTRYVGRGRGGPNRKKRTEIKVRYVITSIARNESLIAKHKQRLGFRVLATHASVAKIPFDTVVRNSRKSYSIEHDFHLIKSRPIGISPLYVRREDQIIGLTHLLMIALRLLTLIQIQVRDALANCGQELEGLYPGQPNRTTSVPTAKRLLRAVAQAEITLTQISIKGQELWYLTPLPDLLDRLLIYLKLDASLYKRLMENSA